jgi:hypothetical protein
MAVPDLSQLGGYLSQCINELLNRGFEPPFYFSCVAVNGAMVYGRYAGIEGQEGMECDLLASHTPESGFAMPINLMIVDQRGEAARVLLNASQEIQLFLN